MEDGEQTGHLCMCYGCLQQWNKSGASGDVTKCIICTYVQMAWNVLGFFLLSYISFWFFFLQGGSPRVLDDSVRKPLRLSSSSLSPLLALRLNKKKTTIIRLQLRPATPDGLRQTTVGACPLRRLSSRLLLFRSC
jgi:hypothetical protein